MFIPDHCWMRVCSCTSSSVCARSLQITKKQIKFNHGWWTTIDLFGLPFRDNDKTSRYISKKMEWFQSSILCCHHPLQFCWGSFTREHNSQCPHGHTFLLQLRIWIKHIFICPCLLTRLFYDLHHSCPICSSPHCRGVPPCLTGGFRSAGCSWREEQSLSLTYSYGTVIFISFSRSMTGSGDKHSLPPNIDFKSSSGISKEVECSVSLRWE